jgi:hypothetical protein
MSVLTLSTPSTPAAATPTGGAGVLVTTGGAVTRIRLTGGRELAGIGHLIGTSVLDRLVLSQSPALDMWFDQAGFRADVPVINRTATTILRAFAALPGNAGREDLRRRRAGQVVFVAPGADGRFAGEMPDLFDRLWAAATVFGAGGAAALMASTALYPATASHCIAIPTEVNDDDPLA